VPNTYLSSYPSGYSPTDSTLAQAQAICLSLYDCGGVTQEVSGWECRKGTNPITSPSGENSYVRKASCGNTVAPSASPAVSPSTTPAASSPSSSKAAVTITFGSGFIFRFNLDSYILGPKQKTINVWAIPDTLTDLTPTGTLSVRDTQTNSVLTLSSTLAAGKVSFTLNYGATKTGVHTWVLTYSGDQNFSASTLTISVIFYNGLSAGHYVISQNEATIGNSVYFFGPNWEQNNGFAVNFNGLVLDTTTAACGNFFSGLQSNSSNTIGPYLGAYVVSALSQTITNTRSQAVLGNIIGVAVIKMSNTNPVSVGLSNPGTGTVVDVYCPASF